MFDKGVSQIINKNIETRYVKEIKWDNRYSFQHSAFNNTKYNAYGEQQPDRKLLPFFVKYTFYKDFKNPKAKLCWKGQAYLKVDNYKGLNHLEKECIFINDFYDNKSNTFTIWLIETGLTKELSVSFFPGKSITIKNITVKYLQFFLALLMCFIIFYKFKKLNILFFFFIISFFISINVYFSTFYIR